MIGVGVVPLSSGLAAQLTSGSSKPLLAPATQWRPIEFMYGHLNGVAFDPVRGVAVTLGAERTTWEWDGNSWRKRLPRTSPPPRAAAAMAYCHVRKTVILFGGIARGKRGGPHLGDTWEWDGNDWRQLSPSRSPSGRMTAMASDPVRKQIVLFGGTPDIWTTLGDTWVWDGNDWTEWYPTNLPWPRFSHAMAFNPTTNRVMMFGGSRGGFYAGSEVQEWNGANWVTLIRPVQPPAQLASALAFDPKRNAVIAHGGGRDDDPKPTWAWDGQRWTRLRPRITPPVGYTFAVTDQARGRLLMLGIDDRDPQFGAQTWTLDNDGWVLLDRVSAPLPNAWNVAHDDARDEIVYYGGLGTGANYEQAMWILRGNQFTRVRPKTLPWYRDESVFFYHPPSRRIILMRLEESAAIWTWDGTDWAKHPLSGRPPVPRYRNFGAYDPRRDKFVLEPYGERDRTWEWDYTTGWRSVSSKTPKVQGRLVFDHRSRRILLFAHSYNAAREVWEWNGRIWTKHSVLTPPGTGTPYFSHRHGAMMLLPGSGFTPPSWKYPELCYLLDGGRWRPLPDSCGCRTISGAGAVSWVITPDFGRQRVLATAQFELATHHLFPRRSYVRPGQPAELDVSYPDNPGQTFWLALSTADWPGIPVRSVPYVGTLRLPIAHTPLFDASVSAGLSVKLDRVGAGYFRVPIPPQPSLVGVEFHAAGVLLGANGIEAVSNAVPLAVIR
ncbi:MAG: hypothetical protein H6837_02120 [Planctomycetes bacterium]|nr:hypothetical protein [Planctomycetota bacterium]